MWKVRSTTRAIKEPKYKPTRLEQLSAKARSSTSSFGTYFQKLWFFNCTSRDQLNEMVMTSGLNIPLIMVMTYENN